MNLYTYILDFRGGTYTTQVCANSVFHSIEKWLTVLKNNINEIQFLGLKSLAAIETEVRAQKPIKLTGLQNTWVIDFTIKQGSGLVNIVKTEPLKELIKQNNLIKIERLIQLLTQKGELKLVEQLKNFTTKEWAKKPYTRFVSAKNANQTGAQWQFARNIKLEYKAAETIIIDILKDGRIGGFELLDKLD